MRNIWKGSISFGLVNIPIKVYSATEDRDVHFNLLHSVCQTPIKYQRRCPNCEREVSPAEIVRGFEYEKDRSVIISDEDLEEVAAQKGRTIDILDFVNLKEIDPVYFAKSYFLAPGEGGMKAYSLLHQAMEESGQIAIARVVLRAKESLAAIRIYQKALMMETMFYPEEIRSVDLLTELHQDFKLQEKEVAMAQSLIASLTTHFNPQNYQSEYRQALRQMIEAKIQGEEVITPAKSQPGKVVDLMEALRASIRLAEGKQAKEPSQEDKQGEAAKTAKESTPRPRKRKKRAELAAK